MPNTVINAKQRLSKEPGSFSPSVTNIRKMSA